MTNIILAHLADLLTFLLVLRVPGATIDMEANPIVRFVYANGGMLGMVGFKIAGLLVLLGLFRSLSNERPKWKGAIAFVIAGFGVLGALVNTASGLAL